MILKKISMLGAPGVGKTSLVRQFVSRMFQDTYHATIGVTTDKKVITVGGRDVTLMLWDVAGPEEQFKVPLHYVRGSAGFLLVIDGTRPETLDAGLDLAGQMDRGIGRLPRVVLLNKADLTDQWRIDDGLLARLGPLNCPVLNSSAKTGENVEAAYHLLAESVLGPPA